jgi:ABC-2 type transport system ATP-binding protein
MRSGDFPAKIDIPPKQISFFVCSNKKALEKELCLELEHVSKKYGEVQAVDNLSLKVFKNDIYGFLGPNGGGKSTSIRMILSLVSPDSGKIRLFGKDLSTDRYTTLSRVGSLVEKPDFYIYLSARKNLEILGQLSNVKNLDKKIDEVLEFVKLSDRQNSKVKTFSQGMRQRLGIAQSILHDPELVILDEPGNGLDPQGQKEMRNLIQKLNSERGITFVISSHILAEIEQIANRMIIINKGKKLVEGEVSELLNGAGILVNFEVSDPEKALLIARKFEKIHDARISEEHKLECRIPRESIPEILPEFEKSQIKVFSVVPARTLEDYFISQIGNE